MAALKVDFVAVASRRRMKAAQWRCGGVGAVWTQLRGLEREGARLCTECIGVWEADSFEEKEPGHSGGAAA